MPFIFFLLASVTVHLQAASLEDFDKAFREDYDICMNHPDQDVAGPLCRVTAQYMPQHSDHKNIYNFNLLMRGCELGSLETCTHIGSEFIMYDRATQARMLTYLRENCVKGNRRTCGGLAKYHEYELRDHKLALRYAKMHFDLHKEGPYVELAYAHGEKKAAFAAIQKECPSQEYEYSCTHYLNNMPDNPHRGQLAAAMAKSCGQIDRDRHPLISGCTAAGVFYYKNKQPAKAHELWARNCRYSDGYSCSLLIHSEHSTDSERLSAAFSFCEDHSYHEFKTFKNGGGGIRVDALRECPKLKEERRIPASILNSGRKNLTADLERMK